jgi:uncharacterized protein YwgA
MERKYWTLFAVTFAGRRGLSPVQLQKSLFLLGKELSSEVGEQFYQFTPHNYGPFDRTIYTDASELAEQGLIRIAEADGGFKEYMPTDVGLQCATLMKHAASTRALDYLNEIVRWAQDLSFSALVRAIYAKYPEYRENSVFQG